MICELCGDSVVSANNGVCDDCLKLLASLQSGLGTTAASAAPSQSALYSPPPGIEPEYSSLPIPAVLAGKLAVVTGANRGIGRAIAERLLDYGADVHVIDIEASNRAAIEAYAMARHRRCTFTLGDVTDDRAMAQAIGEVARARGRIDILVNNAGVFHSATFREHSRRDWDHQFAVNATAPFIMSQTVLPFMPVKGGAAIVNIASVAGKTGAPFSAGYIASKHAIVGLTRAMALDLAPLGINVNAIAPGFVDTDMLKQIVRELAPLVGDSGPEKTLHGLVESVPQHRLMQPRDVADLAVFLVSPTSTGITGQIVNVSGGWLLY